MIEVAGVWEQGYTIPMIEYDCWEMVLNEFGIDRMNMMPISGVIGKKLIEYKSIKAIIEDRPDLTPVFVDEHGETELTDFKHPKNALYIMGRVSYSPFKHLGEGLSVRINTPQKGMLWPHQALAITLYDRSCK